MDQQKIGNNLIIKIIFKQKCQTLLVPASKFGVLLFLFALDYSKL